MVHQKVIVSVLLVAFSLFTAEAAKPRWVKKRPSDVNYFIGIGMAYKNQSSGLDYARKARADALREMASEIEVNISANSLLRQFENNYNFRETFESQISTSAEKNLTGYEVQTWENKREYWVLMRLNKEQYQRRKRMDLEMAKKKAASFFLEARKHLNESEITAALASYFKAIESLENHLKEDLAYKSIDGNINFGTDIMKDLHQLFSQISITPVNQNHTITFSKNLEKPLKATVEYYHPERRRKIPVRNFPVHFFFTEGAGILQEKDISNPGGEITCYIQKLESSRKKQQVVATFDLSALMDEEHIKSPLVNFFVPDETIPKAVFHIELQKSDAWFWATERVFGSPSTSQPFASQLKAQLNETFFNFTNLPQHADYIVEVEVEIRKGDIMEGDGYTVYLAFADLFISVVSADSKTEIFNDAITNVKGMRPGNYEYAIEEVRQKLLDRFKTEIYPKLEALNF